MISHQTIKAGMVGHRAKFERLEDFGSREPVQIPVATIHALPGSNGGLLGKLAPHGHGGEGVFDVVRAIDQFQDGGRGMIALTVTKVMNSSVATRTIGIPLC